MMFVMIFSPMIFWKCQLSTSRHVNVEVSRDGNPTKSCWRCSFINRSVDIIISLHSDSIILRYVLIQTKQTTRGNRELRAQPNTYSSQSWLQALVNCSMGAGYSMHFFLLPWSAVLPITTSSVSLSSTSRRNVILHKFVPCLPSNITMAKIQNVLSSILQNIRFTPQHDANIEHKRDEEWSFEYHCYAPARNLTSSWLHMGCHLSSAIARLVRLWCCNRDCNAPSSITSHPSLPVDSVCW